MVQDSNLLLIELKCCECGRRSDQKMKKGENVGSSEESELGSVSSSQRSFLKNCPFAGGEEDSYSDATEVLGTPISQQRTPILSLSTPINDSLNDEHDVFRTPPENASLSSAGGLKSKSPPVSASPSRAVKRVRFLEPNRVADPEEPLTEVTPLSSLAAKSVRVTRNHSESGGDVRVLGKQPYASSSSSPQSQSASEGIKATESGYKTKIPYRQVIEAIVRNSGVNLDRRDDERVSCVETLKRLGLKFP